MSKILEIMVLKRLLFHLNYNKLSEFYQSAYKTFHSTETALLKVDLFSDILNSIYERKVSFIVLLDLSAAFDTIDHTIFIDRLDQTLGVRGTALCWFSSYLENRSQKNQSRQYIF